MTTTATRGRRAPGRTLKSPLAAAAARAATARSGPESETSVRASVVLSDRAATLAEFEDFLRTTNNRDGRPFEEASIKAYVSPGKNLDTWLTAQKINGDFTVADTATLNRYFREYYLEHGQGGTHTLQRNLIQLFSFLERERGHPSPYAAGLNRYAEVKGRPKTLAADFIDDLLEVTGSGGHATSRPPAIMRSSASCAARASADRNCSAW
jgi:site-specific recombinase XerD